MFYPPDDAIGTSAARFGEETQAGGGVVFNVKWRRYIHTGKNGKAVDFCATHNRHSLKSSMPIH